MSQSSDTPNELTAAQLVAFVQQREIGNLPLRVEVVGWKGETIAGAVADLFMQTAGYAPAAVVLRVTNPQEW